MGGFVHKTLCQVACKTLLVMPVVAVVLVECWALITLLPHLEAKGVEVVSYLIHIHKGFHQPSYQLTGDTDLMVDLLTNEDEERLLKQM